VILMINWLCGIIDQAPPVTSNALGGLL
jgi:hypothetical protein